MRLMSVGSFCSGNAEELVMEGEEDVGNGNLT
jgi:hypothetical protein